MDTIQRICVLTTVIVTYLALAEAKYCATSGRTFRCADNERCCGDSCCYSEPYDDTYRSLKWSVWNMWYFWFIVIFILMTCFGTCGYWRRRHILLAQRQTPASFPALGTRTSQRYHASTMSQPTITVLPGYEVGYLDGHRVIAAPQVVANAAAAAPQTQGMFPAPPPYAEVVSKPDIYRPHSEKEVLPPYPGEGSGDMYPGMLIGQPTNATAHAPSTSNQPAASSTVPPSSEQPN